MAELADAPDLGSGGVIHAGSIPVTRTTSLRTAYRSQRLFIKQSLLVHSVAAIFQIEPAAQALLRFSPGYHAFSRCARVMRRFWRAKPALSFTGLASKALPSPLRAPLREHHIAAAYFTIRTEVFS